MSESPDQNDDKRDRKPSDPQPLRGDSPPEERTDAQARVEAQLQRAMADLANLRKRMHKELDDARRRAIEGFAAELLPVLDNFHLALGARSHADANAGRIDPETIVDGLRMVKSMLEGVLERHGVSEIPSEERDFDPNLHEAVGVDANASGAPGRIVQVMARGYLHGDRVLRPSRVIVSGTIDSAPHRPERDQGNAD